MAILDKNATKMLKYIYRKGYISRSKSDILAKYVKKMDPTQVLIRLLKLDLVEEAIVDGSHVFRITISGAAYIENKRQQFWAFIVPYAITTLIALASLTTSILDVFLSVKA